MLLAAMRALITGGTKGIGRAVALRVAEPQARILLNYLHDDGAAQAAVADVERRGAWVRAVRADAGGLEGARELAEHARADLGGLDLLVHCAVAPVLADALTIEPEEFRAAVERNGMSLLWLVQACRDLLEPGASVIFLSSAGSAKAVRGYVALGAAKALGEALVRYLAAELAGRGVRVNAVSAGPVDTEALRLAVPGAEKLLEAVARANPSGRGLTPEDVAAAVALLASSGAEMVQGEVLRVDGGLSLVR